MPIVIEKHEAAPEEALLETLRSDGFTAEVKDYAPGRTEPHRHDHDIALYVLEGEFRVVDGESGSVCTARPGDRLFVPAGTLHHEEHGTLRLAVGRRR